MAGLIRFDDYSHPVTVDDILESISKGDVIDVDWLSKNRYLSDDILLNFGNCIDLRDVSLRRPISEPVLATLLDNGIRSGQINDVYLVDVLVPQDVSKEFLSKYAPYFDKAFFNACERQYQASFESIRNNLNMYSNSDKSIQVLKGINSVIYTPEGKLASENYIRHVKQNNYAEYLQTHELYESYFNGNDERRQQIYDHVSEKVQEYKEALDSIYR